MVRTRFHFSNAPLWVFTALLSLWSLDAAAQRNRRGASKELGVQLGTMWYTGDLNPGNLFRSVSHVARGGFYRHNLNTRISFRGQFMQGRIESWDADHPNGWQQQRNLHFRNEIREYSFCTELNTATTPWATPNGNWFPFFLEDWRCTRTTQKGRMPMATGNLFSPWARKAKAGLRTWRIT